MTLVLAVAIPLAAAILIVIAGARLPRAALALIGTGAPAFTLGTVVAMAQSFAAGKTELVADLGPWLPLRGADLALRVDPPAVPLLIAITATAALIAIAALVDAQRDAAGRTFAGLALVVAGLLVVVTARDLILLVVGFGVAGASGAVLVGGAARSAEAARDRAVALVTARLGDACLLVAALAALALFQTVDLRQITDRLAAIDLAAPAQNALLVASVLVIVAVASRSGLLPFNGTSGDVHAPASAAAAAMLAASSGVVLLLRTVGALHPSAVAIVGALGAATALVASAASLSAVRREPSRTSALFGAAAAALSGSLFAATLVLIVALLARTAGIVASNSRVPWLGGASTVVALATASVSLPDHPATTTVLLAATALAAFGAAREAREATWSATRRDLARATVAVAALGAGIVVAAGALGGAISLGSTPTTASGGSVLAFVIVAVLGGTILGLSRLRLPARVAAASRAVLQLDALRDATSRSFAAAALIVERGSDLVIERGLHGLARGAARAGEAARAFDAGSAWAHEALLIAATAAIVAYWIAR